MRAQSRVQFWGILILSFLFPLLSFATIQEMIDAAEDGDIILVEAGTYVENIDFGDKNLTLRSVSGPEVTIIDGNNNGSVVMLHGGQSENTILDGFTITNGSGWFNGEELVGGGVAIRFDSSPTLRNLIISDNHATGAGDPGGGGITIALNSNPYLENIVIRGNNSAWGGGVAVRESNPTFRNVDIYDNHASITGGGIYVGVESNPVFENVNVYSNTAVYYGGGAFIHDHSNPTFNKTTFTQNTSPSGGGGMILNHGSAVMVINSIFWGNLPDQLILNNDPAYQPDELMVAYSDIQDGEAGIDPGLGTIEWLAGNIDQDPLFVDPASDEFCLLEDSPCIDAGIAYYAYHGVTYVDMSEDEYYGLAPDMGSCETNFGPQIIMVPGDYATIQAAIDAAASDEDTVEVSAGTYVENIDFGDKNLTLRSVSGPEVTIIDGNNNGSVVMLHGGQSENTVLDGFTITNGSGWHNGEEYVGGGVAIRFDSSPTLRNLIISDNHATGTGDPGGGGITIALNSNPYLENIVIRGNNSAWGGGIAIRASNPTFKNVDIYDNHASITGGGIYVGVESNPVFESVNVYSNTAVYYGGGAFIHDHSNPTFNKTTFTQNTSPSGGGGMILNHGSAVMVINSIFWGNLPDQLILNNDPAYQPDELMVAYSDIQDGEAGIDPGLGTIEWLAGNIESDPLLDGLCIEPESPCIDAGVAYFAYHGVTYVDMSEDEYYGLAPDMGSCETNFGPQIIMVPGDYATIQAAIDAATEADTVVVSAGTYVENIDFNGNDIKVRSESGPDVTIIDGDMNGSTVMFISEEGLGAVLDGFTITNGNGWWNGEERIGGGILVRDGSSPTLKNLVITGNVVDSGTDPIGGGICISMGSNPSLQNIVISNNDADWAGGIAIVYANPTLADIEIFGNQATTTAGGMFVGDLAHPSLERITVHNNYAAFYAGGIFLHNRANVTLDHFTVTNNSCGTSGGGLTVNHNSNPVITNSIFWGNWPDEILLYDDEEFDPNTITISYSDVQNGQWGIGLGNGTLNWDEASNIGAEFEDYPLFCDPESAVFTLAEYSPCAGSGLDGVNMGAWDVACSDPVALDPESDILPEVFGLHQNYPNPFNPSTTINYDLPVDGWVSLKIYDLSGREVNTLISSEKAAGYHSLEWNAVDAQGNSIESGIYLYQLNFRDANGSDTRSTRKFSLLK